MRLYHIVYADFIFVVDKPYKRDCQSLSFNDSYLERFPLPINFLGFTFANSVIESSFL